MNNYIFAPSEALSEAKQHHPCFITGTVSTYVYRSTRTNFQYRMTSTLKACTILASSLHHPRFFPVPYSILASFMFLTPSSLSFMFLTPTSRSSCQATQPHLICACFASSSCLLNSTTTLESRFKLFNCRYISFRL